jgi:uncharacterized protein (TIGR03083 family)
MNVDDYIQALRREGALLVSSSWTADLAAPVPSCPRWQLRNLLAHIGFVHRWATAYVSDGLAEMVNEPDEADVLDAAPSDEMLRDWVEEGHVALVRALSSAPADLTCWTFLDAPSPLAMWARRQAHETAIHRVDTELAGEQPVHPFDATFAVDGIEELIFGFLGRANPERLGGSTLGTLGIAPTDAADRWTLHIQANTVDAERELRSCDAVVHASASDLYLLLWNRHPPGLAVQTVGDDQVVERWRDQFKVTWS